MPTFNDFSKGFDRYIRSCVFLSDSSIEQKKLIYSYLKEFLQGREDEPITVETIMDFRNSFSKNFKVTTINKYMSQLRTMFSWMEESGYWDGANPARKTLKIRSPEHQIKNVLSETDLFRVSHMNEIAPSEDRVTLRRKAVVMILLTSAIRESELIAIRPVDLDWERGTIYIANGKGGKDRTVLFSEPAQAAVMAYMEKSRPAEATDTDPLFISSARFGIVGICRKTVMRDVKEFIQQLTGRTDISPHCLRHTSARQMISAGIPIAEIQALLGHARTTMTEHYAKLLAPDVAPIQSAAKVFNKKHPFDH